jgi:hypothetical protein
MAIRRHIAAALGTTPEAFRAALRDALGEAAEAAEIAETKGWCWIMASVWGVAGTSLDAALGRLPGPGLRVTTEDGDRWYLHLFAPGHEPFTACHEFHYPGPGEAGEAAARDDFLADEEDRRKPFLQVLEHFSWLGCPVPEGVAGALSSKPFREAARGLRDWQNTQIVDSLVRFVIPHRRQPVLATLAWEDVGEAEADSDLGNLPRFLAHLGLDDCFPGWLDAPPESVAPAPDAPAVGVSPTRPTFDYEAHWMRLVLDRVAPLEPAPIEGGSVMLPIGDLGRLKAIAEFCEEFLPAVIRIHAPGGIPVGLVEDDVPGVILRELDGETRLGFQTNSPVDFDDRFPPALAAHLAALPDGTALELVTAGGSLDEEEEPAETEVGSGSHRYAGVVRGGLWHVERAWPAVPRAALLAALDLTAELAAAKGFLARNAEEAEAALAAARRHPYFNDRPPRLAGLRLWCDAWQRGGLGTLLFRLRFGGIWDVASGEADDAAFLGILTPEPRPVAPHRGEVLLAGRGSRYFLADMADLPASDRRALEAAEAGMRAIGFRRLGDLVVEQLDQLVVRAFAPPTGDTYALHVQTVAGNSNIDLVTWFADGSNLTTTTNPNGRSFPEQMMHVRAYAGLGVEALYRKHRAKADLFARRQASRPLPFDPTLEAVARAIDEYLVRRSQC